MIKGVNRQVVELPQPECEYFEKVLFFVKPEYAQVSEGKLRERAASLSTEKNLPAPSRIKRRKWLAAAKIIASASVGALVTAVIFLFVNH